MTATETPEPRAFLTPRRPGEILSGTIAAIERFGGLVALDGGPDHPVFPGIGFITLTEVSWQRFEVATDVVRVGQRVSCEFLPFDTWNGEARLSLKRTRTDPFQEFADGIAVGQGLRGRVARVLPFGVFVRVADGIEGLVHLREPASAPGADPQDVAEAGAEVTVVVTEVDRVQRKLTLSRQQTPPAPH
ncbi:S1 RNA-binding domain-containing protein [Streptomyces sp. NPDC058872]|uniref:S1 RNA-binding domain-containing protein n=1 Tax=Streptomyces sp. NPDC058872 TaxID=3346661 RepID=UPI0036C1F1A1